MTKKDCIKTKKEFEKFRKQYIVSNDDGVEIVPKADAEYYVEEIVIAPIHDPVKMGVFRGLYNKSKDFDMALNPFVTKLDLHVALFCRSIAEGKHTFIPVK